VKPSPQRSLQQFIRYLFVGGFNTVFGYGVFALLNWLLTGMGAFSYMYAAVLANVISITVAFFNYKWFVFRTRGNYLAEWIRCFGVYGTGALIGLAGLPILVPILRHALHRPELASYVAAAVLTVVTVLFSFIGHRNFSFRQTVADKEIPSTDEKDAQKSTSN
jgi:putative flippase GtrA